MAGQQSDDHLNGCMIALMPTAEDAARLAVKGGEAAADLHLTLYFTGEDETLWSEDQRNDLLYCLRLVLDLFDCGPVTGNIFGAAHWNGGSEKPSWVWSVGGDQLEPMHQAAVGALEDMHRQPELPVQHCPWIPHVCAEYSDDLTLVGELEKRLGPVTFDRIRVSFGHEDHDFELTGALTAAGTLHRPPTDLELASRADFAMIDKQWDDAVGSALHDYARAESDQRAELKEQITAAIDSDSPDDLEKLHVDTEHMASLLADHMRRLAITAGKEMQREAEHQGVEIPPWDLDVSLTASTATDMIVSVARMTARALGLNLIQSAARRAMSFVTSGRSGKQVAATVDDGLKDLSPRAPRDFIASAMSSAQNTGRMAVLKVAPEGQYLASEILDKNTCGPCRAIDGTEFTSLSQAAENYPAGAGGYVSCAGGGRCRGTMIAVWSRAEVGSGSQEASMTTVTTPTEELGGKPNPGTKKDKRLEENDEYAGKTLATDDCEGEDCDENMKADSGAAALGLEGITLNADGSITDPNGREIPTPFATDPDACPPGDDEGPSDR